MTRIIEIAHALGEEIAKSTEIAELEKSKGVYESDAELQSKLSEYETERMLLAQEFAKDPDEADEKAIANLKARLEELSAEITQNPHYTNFANAQKAVNDLMNSVNAEIKFCITGVRPDDCTHDCSTCRGCSH